MAAKKLTDKQKAFVIEYTKDLNATQAAIRAGYSENTAQQTGSENLSKPVIQAEIKKRFQKIEEKAEIDVQWVLGTLVEITNRCMQREPVMRFDKEEKTYKQDTDETAEGIWTFNAAGANKAVENIGRHLGMFHDNLNAKVDASELVSLINAGRNRVANDGK